MTLRIALDAMGGERGPEEMVAGAIQAVEESDLDVALIGDENVLNRILQNQPLASSRLHIVHASQTVSMADQEWRSRWCSERGQLRRDHGFSHQIAGPFGKYLKARDCQYIPNSEKASGHDGCGCKC